MAGVTLSDLNLAVNKVGGHTSCITFFVTMGQVTSQPALRIVRTIPNTPVKVRRGSVAVTFSEGCSGQDKEVVNTIFSRWVHTAVWYLYFTVCV